MSNDHLLLSPHDVEEDCWWYEEPAGINIIVEHRTVTGQYCKTKQYTIRWTSLRAALKRKDRKQ